MDEVSRLASYLDGENRLPYDSWMEDSNGDEVPGSWRNRKGDEIKDKE
jgi:hypothetical protein